MFISYIIPPFQSEAYLTRCIKSLYDQTSDDFEVIVAEYRFTTSSQFIQDALENRKNFKVIAECRDEERLASAVRMLDESSEFVQFVEASTVTTPHALATLKEAAGDAQMIIPATVVKTAEGFAKRYQNGWEEAGEAGKLNAFDYCFRRTLFDRYADNIIADLYHVETLLDILLVTGSTLVATDAVCSYITLPEFTFPSIQQEDYDKLLVISSNICKEELGATRVKLFTKYIRRFTAVIDSDRTDYAEKEKAYDTLRAFGRAAQDSYVLSKIFTLNTAVPSQDMENLTLSGFMTLRSEIFRLTDTESSVSTITAIMDETNVQRIESVKRIENATRTFAEKYMLDRQETLKMQEELAALSANLHLLMQRIEAGGIGSGTAPAASSFQNPVTEVPYLFATGKLGFKTIFKCISGWFRYKFSKKK